MDFFKNVFDYLLGSDSKRRHDENKIDPALENSYNPNVPEDIQRAEMDIELPNDFISRTFRGNRPDDDEMTGFQLRNNTPFFGDFSSLFQIVNHFEEAMKEMEKHFGGSMGFHNFPQADFEDMRDGVYRESEKTLVGERLRNYYLNGNNPDMYQGGNQIGMLNNRETDDHQRDLIIDNKGRSDFTVTPYFKSQARYVTTKLGPDGVAEITTIMQDESGNEERMVRRVKLF